MATDDLFAARKSRRIPFDFILDELTDLDPTTRPMFGCVGVYVDEKIVLILRERDSSPDVNGVWLATSAEHHASLKREFPHMRSISVLGDGVTGWQMLSVDANDFEESVLRACELIRMGDPRLGKVPAAKKKRAAGAKPKRTAKKAAVPKKHARTRKTAR